MRLLSAEGVLVFMLRLLQCSLCSLCMVCMVFLHFMACAFARLLFVFCLSTTYFDRMGDGYIGHHQPPATGLRTYVRNSLVMDIIPPGCRVPGCSTCLPPETSPPPHTFGWWLVCVTMWCSRYGSPGAWSTVCGWGDTQE